MISVTQTNNIYFVLTLISVTGFAGKQFLEIVAEFVTANAVKEEIYRVVHIA